MSGGNVFPHLCAPTEEDYLGAVRADILELSKHHTHSTLAQRVGVSAKTIHHAQERKTSLKGWVIQRLEFEFPGSMKNVRALSGGGRKSDPLALADAIKPHLDAIVEAVADQARSRLADEATRGIQ
jgi:hypothetical protein